MPAILASEIPQGAVESRCAPRPAVCAASKVLARCLPLSEGLAARFHLRPLTLSTLSP